MAAYLGRNFRSTAIGFRSTTFQSSSFPCITLLSHQCQLLNNRQKPVEQMKYFNSNRASIGRLRGENYTRLYPTLLALPDGSTITIRYDVPQKIIKLPLDASKLSEEERKLHLLRRKPKEKIVIQEEIEDDFNVDQYSHLWKANKK